MSTRGQRTVVAGSRRRYKHNLDGNKELGKPDNILRSEDRSCTGVATDEAISILYVDQRVVIVAPMSVGRVNATAVNRGNWFAT